MGHSLCLQPWISVSGNGTTVVQDQADWLRIARYQDVVVYAEVGYIFDQATTTTLEIQTGPNREDALFDGETGGPTPYIAHYGFSTSPTLGVQPLRVVRWADTTTTRAPLSRFLRWRVVFGAVYTTITFRLWLNLRQVGG